MVAVVRDFELQLENVKRELRRIKESSEPNPEKDFARLEFKVRRLHEVWQNGNVDLLRELFAEMLVKVEPSFEHYKTKKTTRSRLVKGKIYYRASDLFTLEAPGSPCFPGRCIPPCRSRQVRQVS